MQRLALCCSVLHSVAYFLHVIQPACMAKWTLGQMTVDSHADVLVSVIGCMWWHWWPVLHYQKIERDVTTPWPGLWNAVLRENDANSSHMLFMMQPKTYVRMKKRKKWTHWWESADLRTKPWLLLTWMLTNAITFLSSAVSWPWKSTET